jgi:hypothetical protein
VADLSDSEKRVLQATIARRLGARSDAAKLTSAYLDAMAHNAFARTVQSGPVPTSLTAERSEILIEISRQLERIIEDYEIQALFRVTASQARTLRTTLLAVHSDDADELELQWSLVGASSPGRTKGGSVTGPRITFTGEDRRDAFVEYAERGGHAVEVIHGESASPWQVVVGDTFPAALLPTRP